MNEKQLKIDKMFPNTLRAKQINSFLKKMQQKASEELVSKKQKRELQKKKELLGKESSNSKAN